MASARPSQKEIFVNRLDCSKTLGISTRYLDELVKEKKLFAPNEFGAYDLKVVVPLYVKSLKENTDKSGLTEARRKLAEKQVEKVSISIEIAKGNLHRSEDVKAITANMIAVTRSRLLEMPHRLAGTVLALKDIEAVKSLIQTEVHLALSTLADYDPNAYFQRSRDFVLLGGDAVDDYSPELEGDTKQDPSAV